MHFYKKNDIIRNSNREFYFFFFSLQRPGKIFTSVRFEIMMILSSWINDVKYFFDAEGIFYLFRKFVQFYFILSY